MNKDTMPKELPLPSPYLQFLEERKAYGEAKQASAQWAALGETGQKPYKQRWLTRNAAWLDWVTHKDQKMLWCALS